MFIELQFLLISNLISISIIIRVIGHEFTHPWNCDFSFYPWKLIPLNTNETTVNDCETTVNDCVQLILCSSWSFIWIQTILQGTIIVMTPFRLYLIEISIKAFKDWLHQKKSISTRLSKVDLFRLIFKFVV